MITVSAGRNTTSHGVKYALVITEQMIEQSMQAAIPQGLLWSEPPVARPFPRARGTRFHGPFLRSDRFLV